MNKFRILQKLFLDFMDQLSLWLVSGLTDTSGALRHEALKSFFHVILFFKFLVQ